MACVPAYNPRKEQQQQQQQQPTVPPPRPDVFVAYYAEHWRVGGEGAWGRDEAGSGDGV